MRRLDDVRLDREIVVDEVCRESIVGENSAYPGCRQENRIGSFPRDPITRRSLIQEIELASIYRENFTILTTQATHKCGTHHAIVAGDPYAFSVEREAIDHCGAHAQLS